MFKTEIAVGVRFSIFAIYDKKAMFYATPFFMRNKGEALRAFDDLVNEPKSRVQAHPHDYSLWKIGEWDELLGLLINLEKPEFLEEAASYLKQGELSNGHKI